jgi:hypothetical protein
VWLSDRDQQKAQLLYEVMRDALANGRKYIGVRFFKVEGEGLMTKTDKEHGYSYEGRYAILGMVTWQDQYAANLPKWALPMDYNDFSVKDLPQYSHQLDEQLDDESLRRAMHISRKIVSRVLD